MPRRQVLGRRCQVERKRERQALGTLQSLVVAPATRKRYLEAVSRFLAFLKMHGYSYPRCFAVLDGRVSEFIESLWHSGDPKSFASDCLSGLGHFVPQCKKFLGGLLETSRELDTCWTPRTGAALHPRSSSMPLHNFHFNKGGQILPFCCFLGFWSLCSHWGTFLCQEGWFYLEWRLLPGWCGLFHWQKGDSAQVLKNPWSSMIHG